MTAFEPVFRIQDAILNLSSANADLCGNPHRSRKSANAEDGFKRGGKKG